MPPQTPEDYSLLYSRAGEARTARAPGRLPSATSLAPRTRQSREEQKAPAPTSTCGCPRPRGRRTGRTRRPGAAPGRSCPATLSGLRTLAEVAGRELPAGRPGPAAGAVPAVPPAAPGSRGAAPRRHRAASPAHLPRQRRPGVPQPRVPAQGAAGSPCSASAPSFPHHHPPALLPAPRGAPTACAGGGDSGWGSAASPPDTGLGREATGTLKLLAPAGASLGRTCCGATARLGGVGSGPLRSVRRRRAISPCRLGRRDATLRVGPSVRPCPATTASFRKWRSRAVTARCAPPLTSRHEYA